MIFGILIYISGQDYASHARMGAPPCCPFESSPKEELYREKLVRSITLLPFEMF